MVDERSRRWGRTVQYCTALVFRPLLWIACLHQGGVQPNACPPIGYCLPRFQRGCPGFCARPPPLSGRPNGVPSSDDIYRDSIRLVFQFKGIAGRVSFDHIIRSLAPTFTDLRMSVPTEASCTPCTSRAPEKHPNHQCRGWLHMMAFNSIVIILLPWPNMAAHPSATGSPPLHVHLEPPRSLRKKSQQQWRAAGASLTLIHRHRRNLPRSLPQLETLHLS